MRRPVGPCAGDRSGPRVVAVVDGGPHHAHSPTPRTRAASESAQRDLGAARQARLDAEAPHVGVERVDLDAGTRAQLAHLRSTQEAAAWSLVLLWQPRILSLVARTVRRNAILQPTADDLRQDALTWAHAIALRWNPDAGMGWPGFLKLCLSRRLTDHSRRILTERRRHTDRPLVIDQADADMVTAIPEPADPRPDPEQALADRALHLTIPEPPRRRARASCSPPQNPPCPSAAPSSPPVASSQPCSRLLDAAPITDIQHTILSGRLGAVGTPRSVPDLASTLQMRPTRIKHLQRLALSRLQHILTNHPELVRCAPRWPVTQEPPSPSTEPTQRATPHPDHPHVAPPTPPRHLQLADPDLSPPRGTQLILFGWSLAHAATAVA